MAENAIALRAEPERKYLNGLSATQREELDNIVEELNDVFVLGNVETSRRMGRIVVERIFNGDVAGARSEQNEHPTYRALAEHPGLRPSHTALWYGVAVHEHYRAIDERIVRKLTMAHHRLLAHVHDEDQRAGLARRVVEEQLTADQLDHVIQGDKPPPDPNAPQVGRPRLPDVVKALAKARKALDGEITEKRLLELATKPMKPAERDQAIADVERVAAMAVLLIERLRQVPLL